VTFFHLLLKKLCSRSRREPIIFGVASIAFALVHNLVDAAGIIGTEEILMPINPAVEAHHLKIHRAKSQLEENEGKAIKADKVTEWALLDIADQLSAIKTSLFNIHAAVDGWRRQQK